MIRPVSIKPQVEALTNSESLAPRCCSQSALASLSPISRSARLGVGDAQQRLGQAHQHHALLRGQVVLVQEGVQPPADALGAHRAHQATARARTRSPRLVELRQQEEVQAGRLSRRATARRCARTPPRLRQRRRSRSTYLSRSLVSPSGHPDLHRRARRTPRAWSTSDSHERALGQEREEAEARPARRQAGASRGERLCAWRRRADEQRHRRDPARRQPKAVLRWLANPPGIAPSLRVGLGCSSASLAAGSRSRAGSAV